MTFIWFILNFTLEGFADIESIETETLYLTSIDR